MPTYADGMKRRQLAAVGYHLCSIPYWHWPSGMVCSEKQHVLASLLAPYTQVSA
jgi:hypothetical protein